MKRILYGVISGLLMIAGLVWLIGVTGRADLEVIDIATQLREGLIGIAIVAAGFGLGRIGAGLYA